METDDAETCICTKNFLMSRMRLILTWNKETKMIESRCSCRDWLNDVTDAKLISKWCLMIFIETTFVEKWQLWSILSDRLTQMTLSSEMKVISGCISTQTSHCPRWYSLHYLSRLSEENLDHLSECPSRRDQKMKRSTLVTDQSTPRQKMIEECIVQRQCSPLRPVSNRSSIMYWKSSSVNRVWFAAPEPVVTKAHIRDRNSLKGDWTTLRSECSK